MGAVVEKIQQITGAVECGAPMSKYTTFKIGGPADYLVSPKCADEIAALLSLSKEEGLPVTVIGNGSNLLVDDAGIRGIVIRIEKPMAEVSIDGVNITAGAGVSLSTLCVAAQKAGLTGLEFASGIPGTLGGAVYMNAGAYGGEMKDVVTFCEVLDTDGKLKTITEHEFGYRESIYKSLGHIILKAGLCLKEGDSKEIRAKMQQLSKQRIAKQPIELPSAGSIFKRPPGHFAGALIEQAGLKGYSIGGAQVSNKHAGFIVNTGGATCEDVERLIEHIRSEVFRSFGVMLEPEVKVVKGH